jgi:hypothetical protein
MDSTQDRLLGKWKSVEWYWNNIPYDIPTQVDDLKAESKCHQIEPHISLYYFEIENPPGVPVPDPTKYPMGRSTQVKPTEPGKYIMIIVSDAEERWKQIYLEKDLTRDQKTVVRTKNIIFDHREITISLIRSDHQMFKLYY